MTPVTDDQQPFARLADEHVESKYIYQHAHMHLLSSKLLVGECSCLCFVTVYVRLFIVSFKTIKEKKKQVCFLFFIHNVQVSINNNE